MTNITNFEKMGNVIDLFSQFIESYFDEVWKTREANLTDCTTIQNYLTYSPTSDPEGSSSATFENRKSFADLNYEISDLVVTTDKIVANVVMTGTQLAEFCRLQLNLNRA